MDPVSNASCSYQGPSMEPRSTEDMTQVIDQEQDPIFPTKQPSEDSNFGRTLVCFGAGVLDGATPFVSPVKSFIDRDIDSTCGTSYTVGNVTGTVASMACGVGEAGAVFKGVRVAAKGLSMAKKARVIGSYGVRAAKIVAEKTMERRVLNGNIVNTAVSQGVKYVVDRALQRTKR